MGRFGGKIEFGIRFFFWTLFSNKIMKCRVENRRSRRRNVMKRVWHSCVNSLVANAIMRMRFRYDSTRSSCILHCLRFGLRSNFTKIKNFLYVICKNNRSVLTAMTKSRGNECLVQLSRCNRIDPTVCLCV